MAAGVLVGATCQSAMMAAWQMQGSSACRLVPRTSHSFVVKGFIGTPDCGFPLGPPSLNRRADDLLGQGRDFLGALIPTRSLIHHHSHLARPHPLRPHIPSLSLFSLTPHLPHSDIPTQCPPPPSFPEAPGTHAFGAHHFQLGHVCPLAQLISFRTRPPNFARDQLELRMPQKENTGSGRSSKILCLQM